MLCSTAIRRWLRTIFGDVSQTPQYRQQNHALHLQPRWRQLPQRMHSTAAAAEQGQEPLSTAPIWSPRPKGVNQWGEHKRVNQWGEQRANAIAKRQQFKRTDLKRELPFLRDPLKLADHILGLLRQDEEKKALEMVRLASRRKAAFTVSWNHLVDYEMSKGRVSNAVKIYNEVQARLLHVKKLC